MTSLEIPHEKDRGFHYRFFEVLPGTLSWTLLFLPFILSFVSVFLAIFFILTYIIIFLTRAVAFAIRVLAGYKTMNQHVKLDWREMVQELEVGSVEDVAAGRPKWHIKNLQRLSQRPINFKPSELKHAVMIASYNEGEDVLRPTIEALAASDYDLKKIMLVFAYEERDGAQSEEAVLKLSKEYGSKFERVLSFRHPVTPGEVRGKGGNLTYAARKLNQILDKEGVNPAHVLVTTLDSDNRPHPRYFSALSYVYVSVPDPRHASYQPVSIFNNNIWDAPAPMRVIATGNNFFHMVVTKRPHLARNFSSHAQSLESLIDTDFWSVRTVVEDGHQFWRSYFRYEGDYRVYPLSVPIYHDAVLNKSYARTLKAQFVQLRRWTYGASDIAYIAHMGFFRKNKVPRLDMLAKFFRLLETHVTWASGAVLLAFAAFVPLLLNPDSFAANQLPITVRTIHTVGMLGILVSLFVSLKTLPPRPLRYRRHRTLFMVLQWAFLPFTTILYGSTAAFNSQTRLMFKRYLNKFDVTEKAVKK